ncbi:MAG TPA: aldehyde ferredoxin oxidoreductase, partial [Clostridiales bacterium]|nr:aldehyde ferredoxin oxidoreductase [Clostridiales bacterium]
MSKGYMGKLLIVDLSEGSFRDEHIGDEVFRKYLSGVGLGAHYLYNHIPSGADPLGPDNLLGFMSGLLTGTGSVMTGRWSVVTKSPLTGGWGDANCGGTLSIQIKKCGYDGIIIGGKSSKPVYLQINNNEVTLRDASHLWGMDAIESERVLLGESEVKRNTAVAVIGPAGEKLSLISGISNDFGRYAARSGVGAVMGSKNLKGIILSGTGKVEGNHPELIRSISKEYIDKVRNAKLPGVVKGSMLPIMGYMTGKQKDYGPIDGMITASAMKKWGTIANNTMGMPNGDNPVKNWSGSVKDYPWSSYRSINPDKIISREMKKYSCYSCIIGCGGICDVKDINAIKGDESHKPEYETINAFGPLLMNKDLESLFIINDMLNRGGMDSISAGNTVAFAMECYESGIIDKVFTEGLELNWGNAKAIIKLLRQMIAREGVGEIFADGVKRASETIGSKSKIYAMHVGGQEPGMHDARMDPILGIHFAADPTPGRHTVGAGMYYNIMHLWDYISWAPKVNKGSVKKDDYKSNDEVGLKSAANACIKQVLDGSGGCLFALATGFNHWRLFDYLNAATGWDMTPDDYMETGRRIQSLRQAFNIR